LPPPYREYRGRGIGKEIVKQLLESAEDPSTVYLTTLGNTTPFYTGIGFKECSKVPPNLWFECILGTIVARMVANDRLVVMKYDVT
jgi:N-acetylglutamate synthase-like GNAT family acetyltransferase